MQKKILIIHFRERALYPPLLNLIAFLRSKGIDIKIIDTKTNLNIDNGFVWLNKFLLYCEYAKFIIRSFFFILKYRKQPIIYFESISATPVYLAIKLFKLEHLKLIIHYHEYFSKKEYKKHSFFVRLGRQLEQKIFHIATWVSHTNKQRLDLFYKEFPQLKNDVLQVMPNYPPQSWIEQKEPIKTNNEVVKLVHIGSLSLEGMYLEEVLNHFGSNQDYTIDFYCHNFSKEVQNAIKKHNNCLIKGSIPYNDIPFLKGKYDVGLVLYRGLSLNFKYNAPNKIFEYLALDFDVWCSDKLITARDYKRFDCYPKVLMVNYEKLKQFDRVKALDKNGLNYIQSPYICEPIYNELLKVIDENTYS